MRSRAERDLADALQNSGTPKNATDWMHGLRARTSPNQTLASTARRTLAPLTRQFLNAGVAAAEPEATPAEMHHFRLQGKRIRYSLEIFGPVSGADWEKWIATVRELQDYLGKINDCATTRDLIADPSHNKKSLRAAQSAVEVLMRQRIEAFREYWNNHLGQNERRSWVANARQIGKAA
jgi:CHAD domain-containing protein